MYFKKRRKEERKIIPIVLLIVSGINFLKKLLAFTVNYAVESGINI